MSQANVEVVRRIYEALARGDLRAVLESVDPAIRCYDRPSRPGAEVYVGQTGFLRFCQSDQEVFESVRYDPRTFTDADDQVVVPIRQSGRGKAGRVPVEEDIVNVWKVHRGKAVEVRVYSTEQAALEAVGLSE
jgi:ketosteroid isomerase-like protein